MQRPVTPVVPSCPVLFLPQPVYHGVQRPTTPQLEAELAMLEGPLDDAFENLARTRTVCICALVVLSLSIPLHRTTPPPPHPSL